MKRKHDQKQILFIAPTKSSFIISDINLLSKHHKIKTHIISWDKKHLILLNFIRQFFFLAFNILSSKTIIVSFGGYWSFLPTLFGKIFKKHSFIILHGTDCASIPEINYGSLRKPLLKIFCHLSYKLAYQLLPVSKSLIETNNTFYDLDKQNKQGYSFHFPKLKTKNKVIFNGIDTGFWKQVENIKKDENRFIAVFSEKQYFLKGGDVILNLAKSLENHKFYIAGMDEPSNQDQKSANVLYLGKLSSEKLRDEYSKSTYYLQLSIYEGFGCSLCEAMSCGCIPIGSSVNIIPKIIGESGIIIEKRNIVELEAKTLQLIKSENQYLLSNHARMNIINNYDISIRENQLINLLNKIT